MTHQVILPLNLFKAIADHHQHVAMDTLHQAVQFCNAFYSQHDAEVGQVNGCYGHNVLAFVMLTNPELFSLQSGRVRVAVDGLAQGQTMMQRKNVIYPQDGWHDDIPHTQVCLQVQAEACKQVVTSTMMHDWLSAPRTN